MKKSIPLPNKVYFNNDNAILSVTGTYPRQPSRGGIVFVSHHIYLHSVASEHYNNLGGESITGDRESKSQQYEFTSQQSTAKSLSFPEKQDASGIIYLSEKQSHHKASLLLNVQEIAI